MLVVSSLKTWAVRAERHGQAGARLLELVRVDVCSCHGGDDGDAAGGGTQVV
jgi:hypothetical protein